MNNYLISIVHIFVRAFVALIKVCIKRQWTLVDPRVAGRFANPRSYATPIRITKLAFSISGLNF